MLKRVFPSLLAINYNQSFLMFIPTRINRIINAIFRRRYYLLLMRIT